MWGYIMSVRLRIEHARRGRAGVHVLARDLSLRCEREDVDAVPFQPATVVGVTRHGDNVRVQLTGGLGEASADVTPAAAAALRLQNGQRVFAAVKATETRAYPA